MNNELILFISSPFFLRLFSLFPLSSLPSLLSPLSLSPSPSLSSSSSSSPLSLPLSFLLLLFRRSMLTPTPPRLNGCGRLYQRRCCSPPTVPNVSLSGRSLRIWRSSSILTRLFKMRILFWSREGRGERGGEESGERGTRV